MLTFKKICCCLISLFTIETMEKNITFQRSTYYDMKLCISPILVRRLSEQPMMC